MPAPSNPAILREQDRARGGIKRLSAGQPLPAGPSRYREGSQYKIPYRPKSVGRSSRIWLDVGVKSMSSACWVEINVDSISGAVIHSLSNLPYGVSGLSQPIKADRMPSVLLVHTPPLLRCRHVLTDGNPVPEWQICAIFQKVPIRRNLVLNTRGDMTIRPASYTCFKVSCGYFPSCFHGRVM